MTNQRSLFRRRDSATVLGVSESQVIKYERAGWLPVVRLPGLRAVRHASEDVYALRERFIQQGRHAESVR